MLECWSNGRMGSGKNGEEVAFWLFARPLKLFFKTNLPSFHYSIIPTS
jgi:hypothetical protein